MYLIIYLQSEKTVN